MDNANEQNNNFIKSELSMIRKILISKEGKKTLEYLFLTIFFLTLPYLLKLLMMIPKDVNYNIDWREDFRNGSIMMYSISLLAPIWYTVEGTINNDKIKKEDIPISNTLVVIAISLVLYVVFYLVNLQGSSFPFIFVVITSLVIFVYSSLLAFKTHITEITEVKNPDKNRESDMRKLSNEYNSNNSKSENNKRGINGNSESLATAAKESETNDDDEENETND